MEETPSMRSRGEPAEEAVMVKLPRAPAAAGGEGGGGGGGGRDVPGDGNTALVTATLTKQGMGRPGEVWVVVTVLQMGSVPPKSLHFKEVSVVVMDWEQAARSSGWARESTTLLSTPTWESPGKPVKTLNKSTLPGDEGTMLDVAYSPPRLQGAFLGLGREPSTVMKAARGTPAVVGVRLRVREGVVMGRGMV